MAITISPTMTLSEFENGYRYREQLTHFVRQYIVLKKIAAWNELKELDAPEDYASWVKARVEREAQGKEQVKGECTRSRPSVSPSTTDIGRGWPGPC
jgi:hypothetical protein